MYTRASASYMELSVLSMEGTLAGMEGEAKESDAEHRQRLA